MSSKIIHLNEEAIKGELSVLVRKTVEETLNAFLDKEAQELVSAERYARTSQRQGYRSGHYRRNFTTTSGDNPTSAETERDPCKTVIYGTFEALCVAQNSLNYMLGTSKN